MIKNYPQVFMYHYVKPLEDNHFPYLNKISLEHFEKHLDYIQNHYRILHPDEFLFHLQKNIFPEKCAMLTFDDGLLDHYQYVAPVLKQRALGGIFFVCTQPLIERNILNVHKIHYLYGKKGYPWFAEKFKQCMLEQPTKLGSDIFNHKNACSAYPYDTKQIAEFKYAINYLLPNAIVAEIVEQLFTSIISTKEQAIKEFYSSEKQLKDMLNNGMMIGGHGRTHRVLSTLTDEEVIEEIQQSCQFLSERLNVESNFFSYPYGDVQSINSMVMDKVQMNTVKAAFLAEPSLIFSKYQLGRIDCIELEKTLFK